MQRETKYPTYVGGIVPNNRGHRGHDRYRIVVIVMTRTINLKKSSNYFVLKGINPKN